MYKIIPAAANAAAKSRMHDYYLFIKATATSLLTHYPHTHSRSHITLSFTDGNSNGDDDVDKTTAKRWDTIYVYINIHLWRQ